MKPPVETIVVAGKDAGLRLDRWFKLHFPTVGHSYLQKLLRTGQVRLDPSRRTVHVAGDPVDLTATEFNLLEALMSAGGRVVGRSELLAQAWGQADYTGSRTVDVHVAQLRGKLGPACPIETVRGVGYRVSPE